MRLRTREWRALAAVLLAGTTITGLGNQADHEVGAQEAQDDLPQPSEPVVPDVGELGWQPVLNENFDGTVLDESIWEIHEGPGRSGPGTFTRDAVRVHDGHLTLSTYTEDGQHRTGEIRGGRDAEWFGQAGTYGYIEARVQLNNTQGTRSAFWMLSPTWHGTPFHDPAAAGPEIDMFEKGDPDDNNGDGECQWALLPLPCDELTNTGSHWNAFGEDYTHFKQQVQWDGPSPYGNFITYGLLWTPDGYRIFWDGREVARNQEAITYNPEYIILTQHNWANRAPDGGYGDIDETETRMVVDYVRMWQRPVSHIPDQVIGSHEALAVPFHVTSYLHGTPQEQHPGSVRVTATSSNQALIPDENLAVTGNGPESPDGSFTNGTFADNSAWTFPDLPEPNTAHIWDGRALSDSRSLRLETGGGRAEQTVTGLRPDTTYLLGSRYNLELQWDDINGDGRIDPGDNLTADGAAARFDLGVVVTATTAELDTVSRNRNGWTEQQQWWSPHEDTWNTALSMFTTGPDTTEVTVWFDNTAYADEREASDVSIDDVWLYPMVPPDRTLAALPAPGAAGTTTITLTATDETGATLGTEDVVVRVGDSSFTNGGFETRPLGSTWQLLGSAEVVLEEPFRQNHALELARDTNGTAVQEVTDLAPETDYELSFRARVEEEDGIVGVFVQGHGGPTSSATVESPQWEETSLTFTTDESGSAHILVLDWDVSDGPSTVDDLTLAPVGGPGTSEAPARPLLGDLSEIQLSGSDPTAVAFESGAGEVTAVTSDNVELLPQANIDVAGSDNDQALVLTPVRDRTGLATLTFRDEQGGPLHEMTVKVVADELQNPAFEDGADGWDFSSGGEIAGGDAPRSGEGALQLEPGEQASQLVSGLPYNRDLALRGWSQGDVAVSVSTLADPGERNPTPYEEDFTTGWSSGSWEQQEILFATTQCPGCGPLGAHRVDLNGGHRAVTVSQGGQIEVRFENTGTETAFVDDLGLLHAPAIERIPDISLHEGQTGYAWNTRRLFSVGHIPAYSWQDPGVVEIESSNEEVLPPDRIRVARSSFSGQADRGLSPARWAVEVRAADNGEEDQVTGRSDVTIRLTDPHTGLATERTFTVTVNAGDNFHNGDFERNVSLHQGCTSLDATGWCNAWANRSFEVVERQRWRYLEPHDDNQALRLSSGATGYRITGLEPDTAYVVRANALGNGANSESGDGAQLRVAATDGSWGGTPVPLFGTTRGTVTLNSTGWDATEDLEFTTAADETDVWLFVQMECVPEDPGDDESPCTTVPASDRACARLADGEVCIDDIGVFRAADIN